MTMGNVSLAVDMTGLSGADLLLAITGGGDGQPFNMGKGKVVPGTPFRSAVPKITVKLLGGADVPKPTAKDYVVTAGKRTIALKDGNIILGTVE